MKKEHPDKPWIGNNPFSDFVKAYELEKQNEFLWHRHSNDNFCLSLKEKYADDEKYREAMVLCLASRLKEARLRRLYSDRLDGYWEVWFHIQDIGRMHHMSIHEDFQPLLVEINEYVTPNMWTQYLTQLNKK